MKIDQLILEEYFQDEQLLKSPVYEADPQLGQAVLAARTLHEITTLGTH